MNPESGGHNRKMFWGGWVRGEETLLCTPHPGPSGHPLPSGEGFAPRKEPRAAATFRSGRFSSSLQQHAAGTHLSIRK